MILLTHPTGNAFVRALLEALLARDQLGLFATTIAFTGRENLLTALPSSIRSELSRRQYNVPQEKLLTRPLRDLLRVTANRLGITMRVDPVYLDLDRALAAQLDRIASKHKLTAVYAYEDGAHDTFARARGLGLKRIYDLPIAYWETSQRLLREEATRWPEWTPTLPGLHDSAEKNERKTREAQLADLIVCPSQSAHDSLPGSLRTRAIVSEFGSPPFDEPTFRPVGKKLRVLFAGAMTQRKGLADVFAAMKLLKRDDVELVIMGSPLAPMSFYRAQFDSFAYEAPRPHQAVLQLMETCDVLLLPSIVEGRALVQQEAMSRGLVLVATANAGAQDLIDDGRAGFLIPIRSPEAIAQRLDWLSNNRAVIPEMKRAAHEKASALTWQNYTGKILRAIDNMLAPHTTHAHASA